MEFPRVGIKEISKLSFQELIKNGVEFLRVTQKKNVEFPRVFVFGLGISMGSNTILWNIQGMSFALSGISRGKVKKWKIPGRRVFKKVYPQPTVCIFFWNSPMFFYFETIITFKQNLYVFLSLKCYKCSFVCISNCDIAAMCVLSV